MIIKEDYSYIREQDRILAKQGFAEADVHSLNFARFYSEEEKLQNREQAITMEDEAWDIHCEEVRQATHQKLILIVDMLKDKYRIYNIDEDLKYRDDWDLYFYSNKGWNGKDYFDHMQFNFNDNRPAGQNMALLAELWPLLQDMDIQNIACRVQFSFRPDHDRIAEEARKRFKVYEGVFVVHNGIAGRVKDVGDGYGFFRKAARTRYTPISNVSMLFLEPEKQF